MIILSTQNPKISVYHLGSILLRIMLKNANNELGIYDYYELLNEQQPTTMSRFLLVLDWLYMNGKLNSDREKGILLCS